MKSILLVQHEVNPLLLARLEAAGYEVPIASDVPSARNALSRCPDGVIVDLDLPGCRGVDVRNLLRRESPTLPMLLLAPAGKEIPGLGGLSSADDFMTRPCRVRDLVLRLGVLFRVADDLAAERIHRAGNIELDVEKHAMSLRGAPVRLSAKEFDLLRVLMQAKGRILRRDFLMETIWGCRKGAGTVSRTLDVHIRRLREKLADEGRRILTLRNVGYRLDMGVLTLPMLGRAS